MKILFQSRNDLLTHMGGDTTQILETKKYLEKLGHNVTLDLSARPNVTQYDIVHIFNLQTMDLTLEQVLNAKKQGKKVVLSTIWWDFTFMNLDRDFRKYSKNPLYNLLRYIVCPIFLFNFNKTDVYLSKFIFDIKKRKKGIEILNAVDMILPNSVAELEILVQEFALPKLRGKTNIVVNAVDMDSLNIPSDLKKVNLPNDYVLCVGRIEPCKGQAKIIQAMLKHKGIPLVFIGRGIDSPYGKKCQELANKRGNVYFIPQVDHKNLGVYYKKAKVHVLPSLRESPGLVSLEAALFNTNIVVSYEAPVQEYFKNEALICNPLDIESIEDKIIKAYHAPYNSNLKTIIKEKFTWEQTAKQTELAYKTVLFS